MKNFYFCIITYFNEKSDNGPADKRKMQVLPGRFGGKFDENLNLDDSEHRRKQAAVEVKKSRTQHFSLHLFTGDFEDYEGPRQAGLIP